MATRIDPVCGLEVEETAARDQRLTSAYLGRRYYFCSAGCHARFTADPRPFVFATDMICGREVNIDDAEDVGHYADHNGKRHYFCSQKCRGKFEVNPDNPPKPGERSHGEPAGGEG